ncbi:MAG: hypothetical protein ACFFDW_03980 [Candidatus Thorarchaeota archaeon]
MTTKTENWRLAQNSIAEFFTNHNFAVKQEVTLKIGKRIDIVALKKLPNVFLNVLIEVKDWNNVSRKKESQFCEQIIDYIINYTLEKSRKSPTQDLWNKSNQTSNDLFIGILCLTKDAHFSFRKISHHFVEKNNQILGIPYREQLVERIHLYVARSDFLPKVFEDLRYPLFKETKLIEWLESKKEE